MTHYSYTPGGTLLKVVGVLMTLYLMAAIIGAGSTWAEIRMLKRAKAGASITATQADANDTRQMAIGLFQIGLYLVVGVLFLRLLSRANRNARALGARGLTFTPGWCIGWFFVPIMNLFKPYQAVSEMWQASLSGSKTSRNQTSSSIVGLWWSLWIANLFVGRIVAHGAASGDTIPEILQSSYTALSADMLAIPLSVVALLMLRQLYAMQDKKYRRRRRRTNECPACGEPLEPAARICPMCGKALLPDSRAFSGLV